MKWDVPVRFWKLRGVPAGAEAGRFHAYAERAVWARRGTLAKRAKLVASTVTWPATAAWRCLALTLAHGRTIRGRTGIPMRRQWWGGCVAAVRHLCPPLSYFKYRLYLPERAPHVGEYVWHHEIVALLPWLNRGRDVGRLADKRRFADACAAAGLPHVPIVAVYEGGRRVKGEELPPEDLFLKLPDLFSGRGAEAWRWGGGAYCAGGRRLTPSAFEGHCRAMSRENALLVQRRIDNHPHVARWSGGALCTLRVVTGQEAGGRPEFLVAAFRMPAGDACVDNFGAGGIAAPVDRASGRLGAAVARDLDAPPYAEHPLTRQPIAGQPLPMFEAAIALCLRAHDVIGSLPLVGWDVALTPAGPLLLEANPTWGVEVLQMSHGTPLLPTGVARVALSHLGGVAPAGANFPAN